MKILNFFFFILLLQGCRSTNGDDVAVDKDHIVVIGYTGNVKDGGLVISKTDDKGYYVEGVDSWDENMVGKMVKVSGKLLIDEFPPPKEGEEEKQRIIGTKRSIIEPKWELVK